MNSKQFSEALGNLDLRYVTEAMEYRSPERKKHPLFKRIAVIAAVVTVLFSLSMTISAIREPFFEMIKTVFDDHFELRFDGEVKYTIDDIYGMTVIPEEFELTHESINEYAVHKDYEDSNGNILSFSQTTTAYGTTVNVDSEHSDARILTVNGIEVYVVRSHNNDVTAAFWGNDGYSFHLTYFGSIDLDPFVEMIEGIKIVEALK